MDKLTPHNKKENSPGALKILLLIGVIFIFAQTLERSKEALDLSDKIITTPPIQTVGELTVEIKEIERSQDLTTAYITTIYTNDTNVTFIDIKTFTTATGSNGKIFYEKKAKAIERIEPNETKEIIVKITIPTENQRLKFTVAQEYEYTIMQ